MSADAAVGTTDGTDSFSWLQRGNSSMKHHSKRRLGLELLEDRWVPATYKLIGSSLYIFNPTVTSGTATVNVSQTANNTFLVSNGSSGIVAGVASNIIYKGVNAPSNLNVNLNTFTYNGGLIATMGNGNDTFQLLAAGGRINGNLTLVTGNGQDSVNIGATGGALTALGNVTVVDPVGTDVLNVGNASGPTAIGGSLTATGKFSTVTLSPGAADTYGGNVTINNLLAFGTATTNIGNAANPVTIGGGLTVNGYGADQVVTLDGAALNINGNTTLNLGQGNNTFTASDTVNFNGSFNLTAGSGNNAVGVSANTTFFSNAAMYFGDGTNDFSGLNSAFTAQGNFTIAAGNGDNAAAGATIGGSINGNLYLLFGNGDNGTAANPLAVSGPVGGVVYWRSGNGDSSLALDFNPIPSNNFTINALFGNGNDTFTMDIGATNFLNGILAAGTGTNTFNQVSGQLAPTFQMYNF